MEKTVDMQRIMQEIKAEAAQLPPYHPQATFRKEEPTQADEQTFLDPSASVPTEKATNKLIQILRRVKGFISKQFEEGCAVAEKNTTRAQEMEHYLYRDIEYRVQTLEDDTAQLSCDVQHLSAASRQRKQ